MAQSDRNETGGRWARLGRTTFLIGAVTFVVIGLAHTATHLTTLSADDVVAGYRSAGSIVVNGETVDGWDLFAGSSLLLGLYGIALGALDLAALASTGRTDRLPSAAVSAVNVAMLVAIIVVGVLHLGPLQVVGGSIGLVLFGLPMLAARRTAERVC